MLNYSIFYNFLYLIKMIIILYKMIYEVSEVELLYLANLNDIYKLQEVYLQNKSKFDINYHRKNLMNVLEENLMNVYLHHDELLSLIGFIKIYIINECEPEFIDIYKFLDSAILYYSDCLSDIINAKNINDLKIMTNKYLNHKEQDNPFVMSKYNLVQFIMKATIHQLWQKMAKFNDIDFTEPNLETIQELCKINLL